MDNTIDSALNPCWKTDPEPDDYGNAQNSSLARPDQKQNSTPFGKIEQIVRKMQEELTESEASHVGQVVARERQDISIPPAAQDKSTAISPAAHSDSFQPGDPDKTALRQDFFIDPDCKVWQNPDHFCFNSDSVDLAKFVQVKAGMRILEIGANNGALLVYLDRFHPRQMVGIEILEEPARLARLNLSESAQSDWQIFQGPVQAYQGANFDLVLCNPPFFVLNEEMKKEAEKLSLKQQARFEKNMDLPTMIAQANRLLKSNGRSYFVHRPERLSQAIVELNENNMALSRFQILYDKRDMEPKAILVEAVKEGNCDPKILSPLFRGQSSGKERI